MHNPFLLSATSTIASFSLVVLLLCNICVDIQAFVSHQYNVPLVLEKGGFRTIGRRKNVGFQNNSNIDSQYNGKKERKEILSVYATKENVNNEDEEMMVWNPKARKTLAVLSGIGAAETGLLSALKLFGGENAIGALCSATASSSGGCGNVLSSSYASVGGIPLTLFGFAAYSAVLLLAMYPLIASNNNSGVQNSEQEATDDSLNRLMLLTLTTGMGTFSAFLMSLLIFVLKEMCPFCILSAIISLSLGVITWFGGASTEQNRNAGIAGLSSVMVTTLATVILFVNADSASAGFGNASAGGQNSAQTVMMNQSPPPITESSSQRSIALAKDLKALDARMFGAFWCSHCYDQKQTLGKEAMKMIQYIECDKEGLNNQRPLCQERKVPGYPTWEIAGTLHPGEQSIEELEEIVQKVLDGKQ